MEPIPYWSIRIPTRQHGTLYGRIEKALVVGGEALVHFRGEWNEEEIWIPIRIVEFPDGVVRVFTDSEFLDRYDLRV
jgi:hypothetical protein